MAGLLSKLFSKKRGADDIPDDLLAPASPPIVPTVRVIPRRVPSSLAAVPLADIQLSSSGVSPSTFRDLSLDTAVFSPPINPDAYSTYTVIDVETTGLSCYSDEIIEVSALRFEHFAPTSLFTALVRPAKSSHIPTSASSVNMIADEDLANAVTFLELKDSLQAFLDEAPIIVGHNLPFDVRFLFGAGIEFPADKLYVDTMENARRYLGKQGPFNPPRLLGYSLENVCKFYGVPLKDSHYSAEDCLVTGAVYMALLYDMGQYKRALRIPFSAPEEYISIKSIIPEKDIDKSSPIYHKKIVFTGELSIVRREAMQLAVNAGMSLMSSVTPKTDYLVHGTYINGDYVTGKLKKARELNESGEGHVQIISEAEFMALIGEGVCV